MRQTFVIVLKPNEIEDPDYVGEPRWTPEAVEECFLSTTDQQQVGIAEVVPDDISGGWAEAMLQANAAIDNLGEPATESPEVVEGEAEEEDEPFDVALLSMLRTGALGVTDWTEQEVARYANTAYAVRGFRFRWEDVRVLALVGQMVPIIEVEGCNHDPSKWAPTPGGIECAKDCGALWDVTLAPTPDPHGEA